MLVPKSFITQLALQGRGPCGENLVAMNSAENQPDTTPKLRKYVRAVGPRLRLLLYFIFGLVAMLAANSVYLSAITYLEWLKADPNVTYQNWF